MSSFTPNALPLWRNVQIVAVAWVLYLLYQMVYCVVFQDFVLKSAEGFIDATRWALREWGAWGVLAPVGLVAAESIAKKVGHTKAYAATGLLTVVIALSLRVGFDLYQDRHDALASVIMHAPRHLATAAVTVLGWAIVVSRAGFRLDTQNANRTAPSPAPVRTLLVTKGTSEALIAVDDIVSLRAAGNYVEIDAGGQTYLLRATLSAVHKRLPERFVRIHRCHVVSMPAITRIEFHASGNGAVIMKNGRSLSLSKSYARALKRMRIGAG